MPQEWTAELVARMHLAKVTKKQLAEEAGYTPEFVRQYDILSNKWGDFICQRAYRTNGIHRSSRNT